MKGKGLIKPYLISSEGALLGKSAPSEHAENRKIRFLCPACEKPLKTEGDVSGMNGRCPGCGHVFSIPSKETGKRPSRATKRTPGENSKTGVTQQRSDDEQDWNSSVWKYYEYYINNVISKGSELGKHIKPIGFWWRCFQYVIDLAPAAILIFLLRPDFANDVSYSATVCGSVLVFQALVWSLMETSEYQGSLGKIVLDFRVTTESGHQISFKRALTRNLIKAVMFLPPLCVLFLLIGIDRKKRGLHDRIAKTVVVMESPIAFHWRNERRWVVLWVFAALPFLVYFLFFLKD